MDCRGAILALGWFQMVGPAHSFDRYGPAAPRSPVVLSVPHAGREYPAAMLAALRVPVAALLPLEDRHVDALAIAARGEETLFVQRPARAWIDLNRSELERDPKLDDGAAPPRHAGLSAKLRSGLGLVPRRVAAYGDIWRHRLGHAEVMARILADHRPYHAAIAEALAAARLRFGVAVLLDIHSMPPLCAHDGTVEPPAQIVFGDRFGKSAAARFVDRLEGVASASGHPYALNSPYAGGYILDRHASPRQHIHAVQIEFDRVLYLDSSLENLGPGAAATSGFLRAMIGAVTDEALAGLIALAAE